MPSVKPQRVHRDDDGRITRIDWPPQLDGVAYCTLINRNPSPGQPERWTYPVADAPEVQA